MTGLGNSFIVAQHFGVQKCDAKTFAIVINTPFLISLMTLASIKYISGVSVIVNSLKIGIGADIGNVGQVVGWATAL